MRDDGAVGFDERVRAAERVGPVVVGEVAGEGGVEQFPDRGPIARVELVAQADADDWVRRHAPARGNGRMKMARASTTRPVPATSTFQDRPILEHMGLPSSC